MRELSLHILDVAENSLRAKATLVEIAVIENSDQNRYEIAITDNGCGMDKEYAAAVISPFTTERTTRSVGLGLPLFAATAERSNGTLELTSSPGVGTTVRVMMDRNHIDRPPLGNVGDTIIALLCTESQADLYFLHKVDDEQYVFDTREVKGQLGGLAITTPTVLHWIRDFVNENETYLEQKGASNNEIYS